MKKNVSANVELTKVFNLNASLKESEKSHNEWRKTQRELRYVLNYMWSHHEELIPMYEAIGVVFEKEDRYDRITKASFKRSIESALSEMHENMYGFMEADNGGSFLVRGYWSKKAIKDESGEFVLTDDGKKTYEPVFRAVEGAAYSEAIVWKMLIQSRSYRLDATKEQVAAAA